MTLDPEVLIKMGKVSLQEKQKLIDQALEKSFTISLGEGNFGQCLVSLAMLLYSVIFMRVNVIVLHSNIGSQIVTEHSG